MSISNIERMVDAIVRDEMNCVRSMSLHEMDIYVENLIRCFYEDKSNEYIEKTYELLGD